MLWTRHHHGAAPSRRALGRRQTPDRLQISRGDRPWEHTHPRSTLRGAHLSLFFPVSEAVWQAAPGTGITRTTDRAFRHKLPRMGGPSAHCMPNQLSQILQEPPARPWRRGRGLSMQSRPRGAPALIDVCKWNATVRTLRNNACAPHSQHLPRTRKQSCGPGTRGGPTLFSGAGSRR